MGISDSIINETFGFIKQGQDGKLLDRKERYDSAKAYREAIGVDRYGDFCDLGWLAERIRQYFQQEQKDKSEEELKEEKKLICEMSENMQILKYDNYHPYEIPIVFDFKMLIKKLKNEC